MTNLLQIPLLIVSTVSQQFVLHTPVASLVQDVLTDALADAPIEQDQRGVHLPRHILPRCFNQLSQILKQDFRCDRFHPFPFPKSPLIELI